MARWFSGFSPATIYSFLVGHAWGLDLNGLAAGNTRVGRELLEEAFPDEGQADRRDIQRWDERKAA